MLLPRLSVCWSSLILGVSGAVQSVSAQGGVPTRPLGDVLIATPERYSAASSIRELSDGRVLLNDVVGRRVVLLDSLLRLRRIVADTTPATQLAYGRGPSALFPYRGDSSILVSPNALALLVIDPAGSIVRVMAVPRTQDLAGLSGGSNGLPGFDRSGRLIYRKPPTQKGVVAFEGGEYRIVKTRPDELRDSTPLVRFDLQARRLDTLTFLAFELPGATEYVRDCAKYILPVLNPFAIVDDWALLADGTVAAVRGRGYRVDWIGPELSIRSTGRLQYNWIRLDDDAKRGVLDSTVAAFDRIRRNRALAGSTDLVNGVPATMQAQSIAGTVIGMPGRGCASGAPRPSTRGLGGAGGESGLFPVHLIQPNDLPDFPPAFGMGATVADATGRIWIRTNLTAGGSSLYDIVDPRIGQVERVIAPAGRVIIGFGSRGKVYLAVRDSTGVRVELARER